MNDFKCPDCETVYENAMQLEFHICLKRDPIKELPPESEERKWDFSDIDWQGITKFKVELEEKENISEPDQWNVVGYLDRYVDEHLDGLDAKASIIFFSTPYEDLSQALAQRLQLAYDLEKVSQ